MVKDKLKDENTILKKGWKIYWQLVNYIQYSM